MGLNIIEAFSLDKFQPGYYTFRVSLRDELDNEIFRRHENFIITTAASTPRPWVIAQSLSEPDESHIHYILGSQLLNTKDYSNARIRLEKAYHSDPNNFPYGLHLSQVYFYLEEYDAALKVLLPLIDKGKDDFNFNNLLGQSYLALGKYAEARKLFDDAIRQFGTSVILLNPLGECYFRLGNTTEALVAWEKSLEIDPDQTEIQERVSSLKK